MLKLRQVLITLVLIAVIVQPALAKTKEELAKINAELDALQQGQLQIQKDLDEIKSLLQKVARTPVAAKPVFVPTDIQLSNSPFKGLNDAPVTLIEFSDYQCPYCRRHATIVLPELLKTYVDAGKLRFVMREYPIPNLHPRATDASIAALCAGDQEDYWGMHDALFANQNANTNEDFKEMAAGLGLDEERFGLCLEGNSHSAQIKADQAEGKKLGISGTPSFVLGLTDPDDPSIVHLTKFIRGAQTVPVFSAAINELLESVEGE